MSDHFTGQIIIEVFDLAEADFTDLQNRIEAAAAAHTAIVTVDGRRHPSASHSEGEQR